MVASYTYDAWGNHTVCDEFGDDTTYYGTIGNINPIRYRSYYFDTETGLYYLQTRYYDPEIGRFISPDSTKYLDPESINGLNLYAYCLNNPVNCVDYTGTIALTTILIAMGTGALIGGLVSAGFAIGGQIYQNGWNPMLWDWKQIGLSALGGAVAGAISAIPIPGSSFISYGLTFLAGGAASVVGGMIIFCLFFYNLKFTFWMVLK